MHKFHQSIFREYDIRGVFNETLSESDAYQIGLNYAAKVKGKIAVGRDGRLSSPALSKALINGLTDGGLDVVDIGLVPTPATYFAVFHLDLDGGIMVTGSHNPPTHNGFKIMVGKESLHGAGIASLSEVKAQSSKVKGKVEVIDIRNDYIQKITSDLRPQTLDLKIGYDSGNGASGEIVEMIAPKLSTTHHTLNTNIDGTFPAHHPDPTVEKNLEQLKSLVLEKGLDVGFAFDGDGDRVGVIDNKGRPIWGDQILAILCKPIAKKYPNAPIVVDVKTSQAVINYISSLGLKPVIWKTGHSLIKSKMKELNSPLSGEMSAHIFFKDNYFGFDDGILAAIRFVEVMQEFGKTSAELLDELPKMFSTPELRFTVDEARKFEIVDEVKNQLSTNDQQLVTIDGVRVNSAHGWWLLRASNTGSQLVARIEADSEIELEKLKQTFEKHLKSVGIKL